jgi:hypothetical protein
VMMVGLSSEVEFVHSYELQDKYSDMRFGRSHLNLDIFYSCFKDPCSLLYFLEGRQGVKSGHLNRANVRSINWTRHGCNNSMTRHHQSEGWLFTTTSFRDSVMGTRVSYIAAASSESDCRQSIHRIEKYHDSFD